MIRLDGPTPAERVRDDIRTAILRCDLAPNQPLSVRALAEQHRLRPDKLAFVLRSLEREQLLTVRGEMAIVAPLDETILDEAVRHFTLVWQAYMPSAFERMTRSHLDRMEAILRPSLSGQLHYADIQQDCVRFLTVLLAPGSTRAERQHFQDLFDVGIRYGLCGGIVADAVTDGSADDYVRAQLETIALLRAGHTRAATGNQQQLFRQLRQRQRLALDYPQAIDDQPIATVIPLARAPLRLVGGDRVNGQPSRHHAGTGTPGELDR
jgi:DNA-binding transcriptional regulator YhcF (GntR family)